MKRSLSALIALFLAPCACQKREPSTPVIPKSEMPAFSLVTDAAGIGYRYGKWWKEPGNIQQTIGNGCAFLDYDGDGNLDILLVGQPSALYKGDGKGHFADVSGETGIAALSGRFLGVAVGDYDNDGFDDLYLSAYQGGKLLHNVGGRRFEEVTEAMGVPAQPWGTSCCFLDMNGDGFLDLYIGNYVKFDAATKPQLCPEKGQLTACGPRFYGPEFGTLWINQSGKRFVRDTALLNRVKTSGKVLGVAAAQMPGASRPMLTLANDEMPGDLLIPADSGRYRNDGEASGVAYSKKGDIHGGMGLDWGDFDNDGQIDLFVATFYGEEKALYKNDGGVFEEVSAANGLAPLTPLVSFGVKFADFDNDGYLDLAVASGHIQDNIEKITPSQIYKQPISLLRNKNGKGFEDISERLPAVARLPIAGRGLAIGDYDNDGKIDLLIVDSEGKPLLLHNETRRQEGNGWVSLRLVGTGHSARSAYGAIVTLRIGSQTLTRLCRADGSYLSSSDSRVHFGLGTATSANEITIRWPDGREQHVGSLDADHYYHIIEGDKPTKM